VHACVGAFAYERMCVLLQNVFCYNRWCSLTSYMIGGICVLCVGVFVRILYVLRVYIYAYYVWVCAYVYYMRIVCVHIRELYT